MLKDEKFLSLFVEELRDLYDAERQIVEALPDMIQAASSEELKAAFEDHLNVTRQQLKRLERVFENMEAQPGANNCDGMRGLLAEGKKLISEYPASAVLDAALIGAAQKVEHYEISGYGTARTMAEMLGHEEAVGLLEKTLEEEKDTDSLLTDIAESVVGGDELDDEDLEADEEEMAS